MADELIRNSRLNFIILRLNMVYGNRDNNLNKTINIIKKLPFIPIIGNGKSLIQPVYVEDVVDVIMKCINGRLNNKIYDIGGPNSFSFNDYIEIISNELNINKPKIHFPRHIFLPFVLTIGRFIKLPITHELIYSLPQDKISNIKSAEKELDFKPKDFKGTVPYILKEGLVG